jgi:hypothetical protein
MVGDALDPKSLTAAAEAAFIAVGPATLKRRSTQAGARISATLDPGTRDGQSRRCGTAQDKTLFKRVESDSLFKR